MCTPHWACSVPYVFRKIRLFLISIFKNIAHCYSQLINVLIFTYWVSGHLLSAYEVPGIVLVSTLTEVGKRQSVSFHHGLIHFRKTQALRLKVKDVAAEPSKGSKEAWQWNTKEHCFQGSSQGEPPLSFSPFRSKDDDFKGRRGILRVLVPAMTMIEMLVHLFSVKLTFESLYQSEMLLIESKKKKKKRKKNQPLNMGGYFSYITSHVYLGDW